MKKNKKDLNEKKIITRAKNKNNKIFFVVNNKEDEKYKLNYDLSNIIKQSLDNNGIFKVSIKRNNSIEKFEFNLLK